MCLQEAEESVAAVMARVSVLPRAEALRKRQALASLVLRLNVRAAAGMDQLLGQLQAMETAGQQGPEAADGSASGVSAGVKGGLDTKLLMLYADLDAAAASIAGRSSQQQARPAQQHQEQQQGESSSRTGPATADGVGRSDGNDVDRQRLRKAKRRLQGTVHSAGKPQGSTTSLDTDLSSGLPTCFFGDAACMPHMHASF